MLIMAPSMTMTSEHQTGFGPLHTDDPGFCAFGVIFSPDTWVNPQNYLPDTTRGTGILT